MAALIRHGLLVNRLKSSSTILAVNTTSQQYNVARFKSKKAPRRPVRVLEDENKSLSAKGFLRYRKAYNPPVDVCEKINKICEAHKIPTNDETTIEDTLQRFNIFVACEAELDHPVMNSVLYSIETVGDLKEYYLSPISNTTPLDAMRSMDLPENLHVNFDYNRFHPDTDTMFGGKTAFPKSSTLVTGLKYKKKYKGHYQDHPYIDQMLKI